MALTRSKNPKSHKPQRKVTEIEYRRSLIAPLMLQGADMQTIIRSLAAHKDKDGNPAPIIIGARQIIEDRKAIDADLAAYFANERPNAAAKHYASLQNIQAQLQGAANDAKAAGKLYARVQALTAARQVVMDAAKLAGAIVERQEISGEVRNLNMNADISNQAMLALWESAKKAGLSEEDAKAALQSPDA